MISVTVTDASGRTLSRSDRGCFLTSLSHSELFSIGLNCSLGAKELRPFLEELSMKAPFYVSVYPNAGLPNQFGSMMNHPKRCRFLSVISLPAGCQHHRRLLRHDP